MGVDSNAGSAGINELRGSEMTNKTGTLYAVVESSIKRKWLAKLAFLVLHKVARMDERKAMSWAVKLLSVKVEVVGLRDGEADGTTEPDTMRPMRGQV